MAEPCGFFDFEVTYTISGTQLVGTYDGGTINIDASQFSSNILTMKSNNRTVTFKKNVLF